MKAPRVTIYRARLLHFLDDPDLCAERAYQYYEEGALVIENGRVLAIGNAREILAAYSERTDNSDRTDISHCAEKADPPEIIDYKDYLIIPGLIDAHIHYPQVGAIASYGEQLIDWLNNYAFPAERQFEDKSHGSAIAEFFLDELLRCGTTSAMVFGSVHKQSVDAFFEASERRNMRMICGKVMMDRNAPAYLCDTAQSSYDDSLDLIKKWHGRGRLSYAVTPRFAITSTEEQLEKAGQLVAQHNDIYVQTHISENKNEVATVSQLFPERKDYLEVYDHHGLVGPRSILAHGLYLKKREYARLKESGASIALCPTSNLFLGSGLLDLGALKREEVAYSIGTDVGGGTSFSMLSTLHEAYKVAHLGGHTLSPLKSLYLATLGNAKALHLDDRIGSFRPGNEADFVVLDPKCTPLMALKQGQCETLEDMLFAMIILGDDRAVKATYVAGECRHRRGEVLTS